MFTKGEIIKLIEQQLLEVKGEVLAKNEPEAIGYILRRMSVIFQGFIKSMNYITDPGTGSEHGIQVSDADWLHHI